MHRLILCSFVAYCLFLFSTLPIQAQVYTAVVKRNVNLRIDPSSANPPLRLLRPEEELQLLSPDRVNRYYNVITDADEEGWVWSANIEVDEVQYVAAVERNVNLREDPSTSQPPLRLLTPPDTLELLSLVPQARYYNVRTADALEGWVWGNNINIVEGEIEVDPVPVTQKYPDAHDDPISGWTGPVFKLSQDYPTSLPNVGDEPWKQFDFKNPAEADDYLQAVLEYAMEGNVEVDWVGQDNAVRKWYHTPWLHAGNNGREFVHGMTRERSSRPRELHPNQSETFPNWAVGLYNPRGGFTIGQVWEDPENPDPTAALFPEGAVAIKLLFTTASLDQVPYLENSLAWEGHISRTGSSSTRTIQTVRLLQVDVAIRDNRANNTTGWVFGTFQYDNNATGTTPYERLVPIGLMWGNDPQLTPSQHDSGSQVTESIITNKFPYRDRDLGWLGRLNGPVDNPRSSCLSCHATAQHEPTQMLPRSSASDETKMRWFRNLPAGEPFDAGQISLDYSLQLKEGIEKFHGEQATTIQVVFYRAYWPFSSNWEK